MDNKQVNKGNGWALLPIGVFLVLYIGLGIIFNDFYQMSVVVAFLAALHQRQLIILLYGQREQMQLMLIGLLFAIVSLFSSFHQQMKRVQVQSYLLHASRQQMACLFQIQQLQQFYLRQQQFLQMVQQSRALLIMQVLARCQSYVIWVKIQLIL